MDTEFGSRKPMPVCGAVVLFASLTWWSHEATDRDAVRDGVAADVEHRERIQIARDHVRLIEQPVGRVAQCTLGVPKQLILIRITVCAEVGLDVTPRERRDNEANV